MAQKLTKRVVEALPTKTARYDVFDTEIPGFHIRVSPNGKRNYHLYYRTSSGQERRPKIGQHGAVTCEAAREIARKWYAEVRLGGDPSEYRMNARRSLTVADLCDRYLEEHCKPKLKASTLKTYAWLCEKLIKPAMGSRKIKDLKRADIEKLQRSLKPTHRNANQAVSLLSTMFNFAEQHGEIEQSSNPCRHVKPFKTTRLERYLSPTELQKLRETLDRFEFEQRASIHAIAAIRLLLLTGCRKSEVCNLQWRQIDWENKTLRLPDSKSGAKIVRLNEAAMDVLRSVPRQSGNPHVIAGTKPGAPLKGLQKIWERIRREADIEDVRLHDLRHNFASQAVSLGASLPIIGALLGHKSLQATSRYAHLADAPVREAVERVGERLRA